MKSKTLLATLALYCSIALVSSHSDLCRVAAVCGDGRDFNEVTLNFTEIAENNAGVTSEVLSQITEQLNNQFQDTISSLQDQLLLMQQQQERLNECPSNTYTGFLESSDFVQHRGYFPKMTQFHMCSWIDYAEGESERNRTILSYALGQQPAELLWQIRSATETSIKVGSYTLEFSSHPPVTGKHFMCVGYDGQQSVTLSIDSSTVDTASTTNQLFIQEGGTLVLGKNHPTSVESAVTAETFGSGGIGNLMIWSRVLSDEELENTANTCNCPKDYVITFQHSMVERHGDTEYSVPEICPRVVQSIPATGANQ